MPPRTEEDKARSKARAKAKAEAKAQAKALAKAAGTFFAPRTDAADALITPLQDDSAPPEDSLEDLAPPAETTDDNLAMATDERGGDDVDASSAALVACSADAFVEGPAASSDDGNGCEQDYGSTPKNSPFDDAASVHADTELGVSCVASATSPANLNLSALFGAGLCQFNFGSEGYTDEETLAHRPPNDATYIYILAIGLGWAG
jgi:hypothetical protein